MNLNTVKSSKIKYIQLKKIDVNINRYSKIE